jgi:hypothetical protein
MGLGAEMGSRSEVVCTISMYTSPCLPGPFLSCGMSATYLWLVCRLADPEILSPWICKTSFLSLTHNVFTVYAVTAPTVSSRFTDVILAWFVVL